MNNIILNEIKKALYKEKPIAKRVFFPMQLKYYDAKTSIGEIRFIIPIEDFGTIEWLDEMPAQLLIRWIRGIKFSIDGQ